MPAHVLYQANWTKTANTTSKPTREILHSPKASYEPQKNHAGHGCILFNVGEVPAHVLNQANWTKTANTTTKPTSELLHSPKASYGAPKNHAGHGCILCNVGEVPAHFSNQVNRTKTANKTNKPTRELLHSPKASYEPQKNHAGHGCMLFNVGKVPAHVLNQANRTKTANKTNKPTREILHSPKASYEPTKNHAGHGCNFVNVGEVPAHVLYQANWTKTANTTSKPTREILHSPKASYEPQKNHAGHGCICSMLVKCRHMFCTRPTGRRRQTQQLNPPVIYFTVPRRRTDPQKIMRVMVAFCSMLVKCRHIFESGQQDKDGKQNK